MSLYYLSVSGLSNILEDAAVELLLADSVMVAIVFQLTVIPGI